MFQGYMLDLKSRYNMVSKSIDSRVETMETIESELKEIRAHTQQNADNLLTATK